LDGEATENVIARVWGPTDNMPSGTFFSRPAFEPISVEVSTSNLVGVSIKLVESNNVDNVRAFAEQVNTLCAGFCDNTTVNTIADYIPFASQFLSTVKLATQAPEFAVGLYSQLNADSTLGEDIQIFRWDRVFQVVGEDGEKMGKTLNFTNDSDYTVEYRLIFSPASNE
jgi:hypothetical protein